MPPPAGWLIMPRSHIDLQKPPLWFASDLVMTIKTCCGHDFFNWHKVDTWYIAMELWLQNRVICLGACQMKQMYMYLNVKNICLAKFAREFTWRVQPVCGKICLVSCTSHNWDDKLVMFDRTQINGVSWTTTTTSAAQAMFHKVGPLVATNVINWWPK